MPNEQVYRAAALPNLLTWKRRRLRSNDLLGQVPIAIALGYRPDTIFKRLLLEPIRYAPQWPRS